MTLQIEFKYGSRLFLTMIYQDFAVMITLKSDPKYYIFIDVLIEKYVR